MGDQVSFPIKSGYYNIVQIQKPIPENLERGHCKMTGGHHHSVPSNILACNRSNRARSRMKKRKIQMIQDTEKGSQNLALCFQIKS